MKKINFFFLLCIFLTPGCKRVGQSDDNKLGDVDSIDFHQARTDVLQEIYHRFPSPEEMIEILNQDKPEYIPGIINSEKKSGEYLVSKSQALNLGVYVADLAYLAFYGKHKESIGYLNAIYTLSDKLNIASAFDEKLITRIQNNITNSDSLKVLADYAITSITNYLVSNDNEETFAVISIGGFIEVMYLSLTVTNEFSENNPIIQRIADQKLVVDNLLKYTSQFNDSSVRESSNLLLKIKSVFAGLEVIHSKTEVVRQSDGKLVIKGGDKLIISENQFIELQKAVAEARNTITQN